LHPRHLPEQAVRPAADDAYFIERRPVGLERSRAPRRLNARLENRAGVAIGASVYDGHPAMRDGRRHVGRVQKTDSRDDERPKASLRGGSGDQRRIENRVPATASEASGTAAACPPMFFRTAPPADPPRW
jgi:hypothetical protein